MKRAPPKKKIVLTSSGHSSWYFKDWQRIENFQKNQRDLGNIAEASEVILNKQISKVEGLCAGITMTLSL